MQRHAGENTHHSQDAHRLYTLSHTPPNQHTSTHARARAHTHGPQKRHPSEFTCGGKTAIKYEKNLNGSSPPPPKKILKPNGSICIILIYTGRWQGQKKKKKLHPRHTAENACTHACARTHTPAPPWAGHTHRLCPPPTGTSGRQMPATALSTVFQNTLHARKT